MASVDNMQEVGLDLLARVLQGRAMTKAFLLIGLTAALAACNNEDHNIVAGGPEDDFNAAEANVVLPPAIQASKTYRCADNTIVHVDWLADGKSATVRVGEGSPTSVSATEAGQPMTAEGGYSVAGSADAASAKIAVPGKSAQSCKA